MDVVIPWRGFRCFTPHKHRGRLTPPVLLGVVIPWRGFRCFTRTSLATAPTRTSTLVVIPWRGFRCFTRKCTQSRAS